VPARRGDGRGAERADLQDEDSLWLGHEAVEGSDQEQDERGVVPNRLRPMMVTNGAWKWLSSHSPWSKIARSNGVYPYPLYILRLSRPNQKT